jgi:hypothetical protein
VPVVILAAEYVNDSSARATAAANFSSIGRYVRDWYRYRAGATFFLDGVVFVASTRSAAEWINLSQLSAQSDHRYDYFWAAYDLVAPTAQPGKKYAVSVYAGYQPDTSLGAAAAGVVAVAGPRTSSVSCPTFSPSGSVDTRCADSTYAIGHELGHTWGLGHACDVYPSASSCGQSIMQTGRPPGAILLSGEIDTVRASAWFRY